MNSMFSYVKYSEASFPMTGQYTALLLITSLIWVLLWFGYRQNKINDEIKKKEKEERIKQLKNQAAKDIKNASVKIAIESVEKLITNSLDKSKLDKIYLSSIEETKIALKKKSS